MKRKIPFLSRVTIRRPSLFTVAVLFFTFIALVAAHMTGWAQTAADSTALSTGLGAMIPAAYKPFIFAAFGVYEVIVRVFPTAKNYSIIGWAIKLFQAIVPNKNASTPTQPHP